MEPSKKRVTRHRPESPKDIQGKPFCRKKTPGEFFRRSVFYRNAERPRLSLRTRQGRALKKEIGNFVSVAIQILDLFPARVLTLDGFAVVAPAGREATIHVQEGDDRNTNRFVILRSIWPRHRGHRLFLFKVGAEARFLSLGSPRKEARVANGRRRRRDKELRGCEKAARKASVLERASVSARADTFSLRGLGWCGAFIGLAPARRWEAGRQSGLPAGGMKGALVFAGDGSPVGCGAGSRRDSRKPHEVGFQTSPRSSETSGLTQSDAPLPSRELKIPKPNLKEKSRGDSAGGSKKFGHGEVLNESFLKRDVLDVVAENRERHLIVEVVSEKLIRRKCMPFHGKKILS